MKCNDSEIYSDFKQWLKILRARDGERETDIHQLIKTEERRKKAAEFF